MSFELRLAQCYGLCKTFVVPKCWEGDDDGCKTKQKHNNMQQKRIFPLLKKPFLSKQRKLNGFVLFCFYKATGNAYIFMRNSFSYFFKESIIEIWVRWNKKWAVFFKKNPPTSIQALYNTNVELSIFCPLVLLTPALWSAVSEEPWFNSKYQKWGVDHTNEVWFSDHSARLLMLCKYQLRRKEFH